MRQIPVLKVPAVKCAWVPVTTSYHVRHLMPLLPKDPIPMALLGIEKPVGVVAGDPGTYRARLYRGFTV
jgi:hypothetical protein